MAAAWVGSDSSTHQLYGIVPVSYQPVSHGDAPSTGALQSLVQAQDLKSLFSSMRLRQGTAIDVCESLRHCLAPAFT